MAIQDRVYRAFCRSCDSGNLGHELLTHLGHTPVRELLHDLAARYPGDPKLPEQPRNLIPVKIPGYKPRLFVQLGKRINV